MEARPEKMKKSDVLGIFKRLLGYMIKNYKFSFLLVVICILITAVATMRGMLFVQSLVDDYIVPLMQSASPDFSLLAKALVGIAIMYIIAIVSTYGYNRIMVNVSQGTMKKLRIELFTKMESLPIRFFDTHAHGDIMSVYTNDVDTLRQLFSQSIPQVINALVTMAATFISMLILDVPLTVLTLAMAVIMLIVTKKFSALSGKYFQHQQHDLGAVDGYIEEMMDGQKVVKVFCHEEQAVEEFRKLNDRLRDSADKANRYANLMMPVNANIGNLSYVLCAVFGALLALSGAAGTTVGTIIAFLGLNRNFTQPIAQISQQMTFIVMGQAGANRVFELLDRGAGGRPRLCGTLVNAKEAEDGTLTEAETRTGIWAWKHPHKATVRLLMRSWKEEWSWMAWTLAMTTIKWCFTIFSLYAEPGQKIAFVGSTGAGKTTITNLINRFYDIQDGKIRYDGINITKIRKPDLSAVPSAWYCRIPICLPEPLWTISATESWMPRMKSALRRRNSPTRTVLFTGCRMVIRPCLPETART